MKIGICVLLGAAAAALMTPATMAGASETGEASASGDTAPNYCVHNLANGETACDTSASEARALVADGQQVYTLVELYDWVNFNGDGGVLAFADTSTCTDAYDSEVNDRDLRDQVSGNWSNRISSVRTFHNCDVKLYDNLNLEGSFEGPASTWIHEADHLSEVGDGWNDRASSLRIS